MYLTIQNENYGYSVATRDKWAAVGNPSFNAYPQLTASILTSGSVDVFLYNKQTDTHELKDVLYRHLWNDEEILLAAETSLILHTEDTGSVTTTRDKDLRLDSLKYLTSSYNDYGICLDIHKRSLAIGYTKHSMSFSFPSAAMVVNFSGSGAVDIYNLGSYDADSISHRSDIPITVGYSGLEEQFATSQGNYYRYKVSGIPKKYSKVKLEVYELFGVTRPRGWYSLDTINTDYETGGDYYFTFPTSSKGYIYRVVDAYDGDKYVLSVKNPHPEITNSFGRSVSVNDDWLAIGSPEYSESKGAVYMYRRWNASACNNISWSFHSLVTASDAQTGDYFGWSVELNDAPGFVGYETKSVPFSHSMAVGTNKPSGSKAYYFEISGSDKILTYSTISLSYTDWVYYNVVRSIDNAKWTEEHQFLSTHDNLPLNFYPEVYPILSGSYAQSVNVPDKFGFDVSIYGGTVAVGAPTDRHYYEYSSSNVYQQGAFYIFERCSPVERGWYKKLKSNGTDKCLKSHRLGYCLDTYDNKLVVGCPKTTATTDAIGSTISSCYTQGSIYNAHFCEAEKYTIESQLQGQFCYLQYNTSSTEWDYNNVYQIKKRYLAPYRNFGYSIDMSDRFIIVGSPMNLSGSGRTVNIPYTGSSPDDFDPVAGQAYIYNLENYRNQFHVGNAFYRNGKIVLLTSGSNFDGLFFNDVADRYYEYDLSFNNKQTLHEKQVICEVSAGEFNVSTNPSATTITGSIFDFNGNGKVDFQDVNIMLMYMNTRVSGNVDWSSSVLTAGDEISWYNHLNDSNGYYGTTELYSSSFATLNTTAMYRELDFNQDNIIDQNDQSILWKYFSNRLNQKNFDKYISTNAKRRLYSDMIDHLNKKTNKNLVPSIKTDFFDYERLSKTDITGSYLTPFVTSVGLYQNGELAAVAKLGSPIKLIPDFPYNFVIKMDF